MSDPDLVRLRAVPDIYAQPDPATLATIPKGGVQLSYMGHAEVTLALIDVDPQWTWEPVAFDPQTGGPAIEAHGKRLVMWGWLTVLGVRRLCVGTCEPNKSDPEKELIGDLLRNGAMRFGIGTKLWSKATDADPAGSGGAGFKRGTSKPDPVIALWERVKATKDTPKAKEIKDLAAANGKEITPKALADDPMWFELVAATVAK